MPTSKQARSAQERQKDRLAVLAAQRAEKKRRRRRVFLVGGALVIILAVVIGQVVRDSTGGSKKQATATTVPAATAAVPTALGKPCVAMKGKPPAGAPSVPITPGPPPTKLMTRDIRQGSGAVVTKAMQHVTVNYIGVACSTGAIFDSSYSRKQPLDVDISGTDPQRTVIQGWNEGLVGMKVGGSRLIAIPPDLAYKDKTPGAPILADETLYFVVDAVSAK